MCFPKTELVLFDSSVTHQSSAVFHLGRLCCQYFSHMCVEKGSFIECGPCHRIGSSVLRFILCSFFSYSVIPRSGKRSTWSASCLSANVCTTVWLLPFSEISSRRVANYVLWQTLVPRVESRTINKYFGHVIHGCLRSNISSRLNINHELCFSRLI